MTKSNFLRLLSLASLLALGACRGEPKTAKEIIDHLDEYTGKHVRMIAKFKAGIRCKLDTEDGEWKTYCGDCQVCKGPYVVDLSDEDGEEWPLVLGGTYDYKDVRCKGELNAVECHPLEVGKTYVVEGLIERTNPPKLYLDDFELVEE